MLPDSPAVKAHASLALLSWTQQQIPQIAPLLGQIAQTTQHEGRAARFLREDGSEGRLDYQATSFPFEILREEMRTLDLPRLQEKLIELATKFAEAHEQMMFRRLNEAVEEVGNSVDAGGDLQPHHMIEMLRKMRIDFDPATNEPKGLAFVVHPTGLDHLLAKWKKWEQDPGFVAEWERVMAEKREEWRARESDRRLVD